MHVYMYVHSISRGLRAGSWMSAGLQAQSVERTPEMLNAPPLLQPGPQCSSHTRGTLQTALPGHAEVSNPYLPDWGPPPCPQEGPRLHQLEPQWP